MYKIIFYHYENGYEPVNAYIEELSARKDKDSRIKCNKIRECIRVLQEHGTRAGEPYMKHLNGEIWELRTLRDRILFAAWGWRRICTSSPFCEKDTENTTKRNR